MQSNEYQLNALELSNLTIPLLSQSTHRGCTGIGRQLHLFNCKRLSEGHKRASYNIYITAFLKVKDLRRKIG